MSVMDPKQGHEAINMTTKLPETHEWHIDSPAVAMFAAERWRHGIVFVLM